MGVKTGHSPLANADIVMCENVFPFFGMFSWRDAQEKNLLSPLSL